MLAHVFFLTIMLTYSYMQANPQVSRIEKLSGLEVSPLKVSGGSPVHLRSKHQVLVGKTRWVKKKKQKKPQVSWPNRGLGQRCAGACWAPQPYGQSEYTCVFCVYICIYMCVYVYVYIYIYTHITHTHTYTYTYKHIHINQSINQASKLYIYIYIYTHTYHIISYHIISYHIISYMCVYIYIYIYRGNFTSQDFDSFPRNSFS